MDKQRNCQPKREPDVGFFRSWKAEKGEDYGKALLEINYDQGEEMHERRVYSSPQILPPPLVTGCSLLVFSKKKAKQYWVVMIGWDELSDLSKTGTANDLCKIISEVYPSAFRQTATNWLGQLEGFIGTEVLGPFSLEEYGELIKRLEDGFAPLFDTAALVTPGKTYNEEREREKEPQRLSVIGPDGVDGLGQHHYKLGQFVIIYYHGEIDWEYYLEEDDGLLTVFAGRALIGDCDVLLMSPWKIHNKAEEWKTLEECNKWRDSLPVWDKTPYFVKMVDIGGTRLMDCKTLQPASEEDQERIMHQLGFFRSKERSKEDAETLKGLRETSTEFTD